MAYRPVIRAARLGVHCASTLKLSRRIPSAASLSIRGVAAPRRIPPPYTPGSPQPRLSISTTTMLGCLPAGTGLVPCAWAYPTSMLKTNAARAQDRIQSEMFILSLLQTPTHGSSSGVQFEAHIGCDRRTPDDCRKLCGPVP